MSGCLVPPLSPIGIDLLDLVKRIEKLEDSDRSQIQVNKEISDEFDKVLERLDRVDAALAGVSKKVVHIDKEFGLLVDGTFHDIKLLEEKINRLSSGYSLKATPFGKSLSNCKACEGRGIVWG